MNYLEEYMKLSDNAHRARELAEQLKSKIDSSLETLNSFLAEDLKRPAIIEKYEPIDFSGE